MARLSLRSKFRKLSYKNAKTPEGATDFLVLTKNGGNMGSNKPTHINENVYLSIKSSSSSFNDKSSGNRGKAVENQVQACGKSGIKSAKPVEKDVKKITSHVAEAKANVLVAIFNAPHCREFFLKCVYHLPEQDIARAVDVSTRPNIVSPIRYFNKTCKQMMVNRGL